MALYYFDASALVKYYVTEPGSTWIRQLIDAQDSATGQPHHLILIAEITRVAEYHDTKYPKGDHSRSSSGQ